MRKDLLGYDMDDDMLLKQLGNDLHYGLMQLSGGAGWESFGFSTSVTEQVLGFVPHGDGPNKLSDEEKRAAIPRVEAMLMVVKTLIAMEDRR